MTASAAAAAIPFILALLSFSINYGYKGMPKGLAKFVAGKVFTGAYLLLGPLIIYFELAGK